MKFNHWFVKYLVEPGNVNFPSETNLAVGHTFLTAHPKDTPMLKIHSSKCGTLGQRSFLEEEWRFHV